MADIKMGYMGYAEIDGLKVRCNDFNLKLKQDVLFYDHIIGLRDTTPTDILGGKEDGGLFNEQKIFWRSSTKIVEGSINFLSSENSSTAFLLPSIYGDDFDVSLYYSCETGRKFTKCKANTYSFSVTAGELVNISVGVMGTNVEDIGAPSVYEEVEKLYTWDEVKISGTGADSGIVSFEFSINNNCLPIYTAGTNVGVDKLIVHAIRVGMQLVTGSIVFYNDIGPDDTLIEEAVPREITVTVGDFSVKLNVIYQFPERTGQVSPYVRTITFVGVGKAIEPTA